MILLFRINLLASLILYNKYAFALSEEKANIANNSGSFTIIVAAVAFCGVIVSSFVSYYVANRTSLNNLSLEQIKRQNDLALKISELVSSPEEHIRNSSMRRFAVAIVKVMRDNGNQSTGHVHFIPMNSRVTVGLNIHNDIVLEDKDRMISRWHCGFSADQSDVYIEDYASTNGTKVNNDIIKDPMILKDGDLIRIGGHMLYFKKINQNKILSK